ncbi:hypothetical protein AAFF27_15515 [Xylophilus sp. GW821-FHT01B05]
METAVLARTHLFAPLSAWMGRLASRRIADLAALAAPAAASSRRLPPHAPGPADKAAVQAYPSCANDAAGPPAGAMRRRAPALRVVHVVDGPQSAHCAGRMVISGRMADVCAELDRLSAREAAMH